MPATNTTEPKTAIPDPPPELTEADFERRLEAVSNWLFEGVPAPMVIERVMHYWNVARRTAQDYVQRCRERLAEDAAREQRLTQLRIAQEQRNMLFQALVLELARQPMWDPERLRVLTAAVNAGCRLLNDRDRAARDIHKELGLIDDSEDKPKKKKKADVEPDLAAIRREAEAIAERNRDARKAFGIAEPNGGNDEEVFHDDDDEELDEEEHLARFDAAERDFPTPPSADFPAEVRTSKGYRIVQAAADDQFLADLIGVFCRKLTWDDVYRLWNCYRHNPAKCAAVMPPAAIPLLEELKNRVDKIVRDKVAERHSSNGSNDMGRK